VKHCTKSSRAAQTDTKTATPHIIPRKAAKNIFVAVFHVKHCREEAKWRPGDGGRRGEGVKSGVSCETRVILHFWRRFNESYGKTVFHVKHGRTRRF
jgi:hypothetical protein